MDYYTKIYRSTFSRINEVGAKPFLLFQYYLTYATAKKINPTLKTIALDMGILDKQGKPQISAVSHLKKTLINAGWVKEENGEIFITLEGENVEKISTPDLRKSQQSIEKISTIVEKNSINVEKISTPIYKEREIKEIKEIKREEHTHPRENFSCQLLQFVQEQKNTLAGLKDAPKWQRVFELAFDKQIEASEVERCYLLLEKQRVIKKASWQITPDMISENLLNMERLESEIFRLENNGVNQNAKQHSTGKKGNADIIAEYEEYFASEAFQNLGSN
jgi:hypothetical protein